MIPKYLDAREIEEEMMLLNGKQADLEREMVKGSISQEEVARMALAKLDSAYFEILSLLEWVYVADEKDAC